MTGPAVGDMGTHPGPEPPNGAGYDLVVPTDDTTLPTSILLWDADEVSAPPPAPCCLRSTSSGDRAVVYRTGPGGGVEALVDFTADAEPNPRGGWCAPASTRRVGRPIARPELLADDVLAAVFRHLRGRRRLPEAAAARLMALL